jgi:hypothetical protein
MKYYKIHYEVDTGYDYIKDAAIVKAESTIEAVAKLKYYISDTGYEHMVSKVFSIDEFTEDVFSSRFTLKVIQYKDVKRK